MFARVIFFAKEKPWPKQWRIQNAEIVTHIKGRLLYQAMILYSYVPFQNENFSQGKNLLSEGTNSFLLEQFLIVWKITDITLSDLALMLQFYYARA